MAVFIATCGRMIRNAGQADRICYAEGCLYGISLPEGLSVSCLESAAWPLALGCCLPDVVLLLSCYSVRLWSAARPGRQPPIVGHVRVEEDESRALRGDVGAYP
jgi:hypothetical protein